MNINKTQNVNFKGTVHLEGDAVKNKSLRPLIYFLKHHCGNKDVHHSIYEKNSCLGLSSIYTTKVPVNEIKNHQRAFGFFSAFGRARANKDNDVACLLYLALETKNWFQNLRKQEKALLKQIQIEELQEI